MAWEQGRAVVENLIRTGMLEQVPPNLDAAQSLVDVAETHLASALTLADTDTVLAYDALHGANRKALTAILLAQGLRPTRAGGHIALYDAVLAQLDPPAATSPRITGFAGPGTPVTTARSTTPSPTTSAPTTPAAGRSSTSPSASSARCHPSDR